MNTVFGKDVIISNRKAIVDGVEYPFLDNMKGNNITTVNNKVYVNGYELINAEWKRTLKAMWHMLF